MSHLKKVLLLTDIEFAFGRAVTRGVMRYAGPDRGWMMGWLPPSSATSDDVARIGPEGLIGSVFHLHLNTLRMLRRKGVSVVNLARLWRRDDMPAVFVDDDVCGRMGAEYFLAKGYRNLGFVGHPTFTYSIQREQAFQQTVTARGLTCHCLRCAEQSGASKIALPVGALANQVLIRWLRQLPKPAAVMACADHYALDVSHACQAARIKVPEEVAVLGVYNDEIIDHLGDPPLSSIQVPAERLGYEAAVLLESLMRGRPWPKQPLLVPPLGIVERRSTDAVAVDDPAVVSAMRYIHRHAHEPMSVKVLVSSLPMSRRCLEMHFRKATGRSVGQEMSRVRIEQVKQLLADTDVPLPAIAKRCGLSGSERLCVMFKRGTGMTPGRYRGMNRIRGPEDTGPREGKCAP